MNWACEINNDPHYVILASIITGFLFSGISWGFVYVILFLIIWEVVYYAYSDCNLMCWNFDLRVTIVLGALLGYLAGRNLHEIDDHLQDCYDFKDHLNCYGKECGWFND